MSYDNDYNPMSGAFGGDTGHRSRGAGCGAGEVKALLQRIAEHIANADERQQATLENMHAWLVHMAEEAQAARNSAPPELKEAFARIEQSIAALSDRIASREETRASDTQEAFSRGNEEPESFWPTDYTSKNTTSGRSSDFQSGQSQSHWYRSAEAPPPLRSAAVQLNDHWSSHSSGAAASAGGTAMRHSFEDDQDSEWDRTSAEALTRIYEPEPENHRSRNGSDSAGNSDRLETRFEEIAANVEKLLSQVNLGSVSALETRLERIEKKLGSALGEIARQAHIDDLRAVEAHIGELADHVERANLRLAQLDEIDGHIRHLLNQVSDEHLDKLFEQRLLDEDRLAAIAEAVAEQLSKKGVSGDRAALECLRELHEVIAEFVYTQRQNDHQTAGALAAIQEAVVSLLDRMDALEQMRSLTRERSQPARWEQTHAEKPAASDPVYAFGTSRSAAFERKESEAVLEAEVVEGTSIPEASSPEARGDGAQMSEAEDIKEESAKSDQPAAPTVPLRTSREEFLAAARRAARKASEEAQHESPSGGRFRRAAGARPVTGLLMATLAVVLAAGVGVTGYSVYKGEHSLDAFIPASISKSLEGMFVGEKVQPAAGAKAESEAPGIIIEDPPALGPATPVPDDQKRNTRTAIPLPGSIVDHGVLSIGDFGTSSSPAAYTPDDAGPVQAPSLPSQKPQASNLMPPAAVGPLSLRLAAANGDPSAEFEVALRFDEGRGVERNLTEAVTWYQRSASRGFAPAQYRLGTLYERGLGVPMDRGRAMAWYRSAAEKGHVKAMHNFAVLVANGASSDFKTAAYWFEEAAARGLVDSQYNLAVLYESGHGVERDLKQAYKWFALAARGGDQEAARRRDRVKWMLGASELKTAEAMVQSWKPKPSEPTVNDVRTAGELWKLREKQG